MLGRLATYVVPVSAVVVTALVIFGPGSPRPAPFARIRGQRFTADRVSLRIEGGRRLFGVDSVAAFEGVRVEVREGSAELGPAIVSLGPDGVGEILFEAKQPIQGGYVRVMLGEAVLAEGQLPQRTEYAGETLPAAREIRGVTSGDLLLHVEARRGTIVSPFKEKLDIAVSLAPHVSPYEQEFEEVTIEASALGAEIEPKELKTQGRATLTVKPLSPTVELTLDASSKIGRKGRWEGLLPVVLGATWLAPEDTKKLTFVSPSPRERVYVSINDPLGRLLGAVVPMKRSEDGFFYGSLDFERREGHESPTEVIVSSDPSEQSDSTVIWPLDAHFPVASRLDLLIDGAPIAEARELERAAKARYMAAFLVGAAALAEVLLIVLRSRQAQQELEKNLGEAMPRARKTREKILQASRGAGALRVALAAALVLLAFAMVAALLTFRG